MPPISLAFFWHQHQPYYPDDLSGENLVAACVDDLEAIPGQREPNGVTETHAEHRRRHARRRDRQEFAVEMTDRQAAGHAGDDSLEPEAHRV